MVHAYRVVHNALDLDDHYLLDYPVTPCVHMGTVRDADEIVEVWLPDDVAERLGLDDLSRREVGQRGAAAAAAALKGPPS